MLLGELAVTGIPPGPAGSTFDVRFTYDTNGILEVDAIVSSTGKSFSTIITSANVTLSKNEIKEAVRKMQAVKFYPREDMENQLLLRFCERVIGELDPASRNILDRAIDVWEKSMRSNDRESFELAKIGLLDLLEQLRFPFSSNDQGR